MEGQDMTSDIHGLTSVRNNEPSHPATPDMDASTLAIHADDQADTIPDVAPALHLSTTFRYNCNPEALVTASELKGHPATDSHIYSRETAPNSTRLERLLSPILRAKCVTYSSGLSALHAAYVHLNPKRVSVGLGYHGSHGVLSLHVKLTGAKILPLDCPVEDLGEGDVVHLETPINPTGEAFNIQHFADKAHSRGAYLLVDSTFGPPGLQDPFLWGADLVMHSGTKYLGGHSDMLCGVLACRNEDMVQGLIHERTYLGSVLGSLEAWLGIRSIRTLSLRVQRQSENASKLVSSLHTMLSGGPASDSREVAALQKCIRALHHASLQEREDWLTRQMPNGFGPVFAMTMKSEDLARRLPSRLELFNHATSLGGVESLVEWRAMSDPTIDRKLLRISVGIESENDLLQDLLKAFVALQSEEQELPLKIATNRE